MLLFILFFLKFFQNQIFYEFSLTNTILLFMISSLSITTIITAKINQKTKGEGQTPIHYAARNNAVATLKILIKLGASITDRDYKSRTPLYVAAENGENLLNMILLWATRTTTATFRKGLGHESRT